MHTDEIKCTGKASCTGEQGIAMRIERIDAMTDI